ncbi:MAG: FecR domain-containing protein [Chitinophagaceae bacterium]|nr:FecR domain-containing protein [Chitinophagaceae bacterium]
MDKTIISSLIERYLANSISDEEREQLLLLTKENNELVTEVLSNMLLARTAGNESIDKDLMQKTLEKVLAIDKEPQPSQPGRLFRIPGKWWWAAAAALIIGGTTLTIYQFNQKSNKEAIAISHTGPGENIEAPQTNHATVTLADGSVLYLDNLKDGEIAQNGNVKLIKLNNGQIAYQTAKGEISQGLLYNTLTNPRGSKVIHLKLADGSRVWLNAESSITYPVAFTGNDRKVTLRGEGYFDVAHDDSKPFLVEAGKIYVRVLGTQFNLNAYSDQEAVLASLIKGSVEVGNGAGSTLRLKPGNQAIAQTGNEKLQLKSAVDTSQVLAWKNGFFSFRNASLKEIMQQISRWYDVDVQYEGTIEPRQFRGIIPKTSDMSEVLQILEESKVHFKVEGRKLKVYP